MFNSAIYAPLPARNFHDASVVTFAVTFTTTATVINKYFKITFVIYAGTEFI